MQYIRDYYKVPAKRGAIIEYHGDEEIGRFIRGFLYVPRRGVIVAAKGNYLRVRFNDSNHITTIHPTWKVKYVRD
jgi:hypothetical protein